MFRRSAHGLDDSRDVEEPGLGTESGVFLCGLSGMPGRGLAPAGGGGNLSEVMDPSNVTG